jgi:hypothetical protein
MTTRLAVAPDPGPALRLLSLGAGVQSTTVLLLACEGVIPRFDVALFADTGWEPRAVYENLVRLRAHAATFGIPGRTVSAGNIRDDALDPAHRFVSMPLRPPQVHDFRRGVWAEPKGFTRRTSGCTRHWSPSKSSPQLTGRPGSSPCPPTTQHRAPHSPAHRPPDGDPVPGCLRVPHAARWAVDSPSAGWCAPAGNGRVRGRRKVIGHRRLANSSCTKRGYTGGAHSHGPARLVSSPAKESVMNSAAHRTGHGEPTTPVRVAFYGRVTTDRDEQPLKSMRQALAVRRVLESMAPLPSCHTDTVSDDMESSRWDVRQAQRGQR